MLTEDRRQTQQLQLKLFNLLPRVSHNVVGGGIWLSIFAVSAKLALKHSTKLITYCRTTNALYIFSMAVQMLNTCSTLFEEGQIYAACFFSVAL